jgi:hypothetical protein
MNVELSEGNAEALAEREDAGEFVNAILAAYLAGDFIRKSDVAGMVTVPKPYRRLAFEGSEIYDAVTQHFKGISIEGQSPSQALFIPSEKLHDLVQENQIILVLKSKRTRGIRNEEVDQMFTKLHKDELS